MKTINNPLPKIVTKDDWLYQRHELLKLEKEATRVLDKVRAERRRMPMVKIEKEYKFEGQNGIVKLIDLFEGRRQLLVHHFMWFDKTDTFCGGCSMEANQNYNDVLFAELHKRDVTLAAVARAPFSRIEKEKAEKGWNFPFYSSGNSDFNYDFQATIDKNRNTEFNYQNTNSVNWLKGFEGDMPAKSCFITDGSTVYHTYSAYTRGTDLLGTHYNYLDLTPYGRQEAWEKSPDGWPQKPTYG